MISHYDFTTELLDEQIDVDAVQATLQKSFDYAVENPAVGMYGGKVTQYGVNQKLAGMDILDYMRFQNPEGLRVNQFNKTVLHTNSQIMTLLSRYDPRESEDDGGLGPFCNRLPEHTLPDNGVIDYLVSDINTEDVIPRFLQRMQQERRAEYDEMMKYAWACYYYHGGNTERAIKDQMNCNIRNALGWKEAAVMDHAKEEEEFDNYGS